MTTATFCTSDGVEYVVPVAAPSGDGSGVTLLDAAEAAGYTLVSMCHHGGCGVCHARIGEGRAQMMDHSESVLDGEAVAAGEILLCCAQPEGDVRVDLPYDSSRVLTGAVPVRTVTVASLDRWAGDIVRLLVQVDDSPEYGVAMQFDPGQFAELTPPDGQRSRAYSFASVGNWDGTAEFYVKLREGGYFSDYLEHSAAVGDKLTMRGPLGAFGLKENGSRPRWMVCGGTGLAPFMSLLRRMAEWGETQPVLLILGVNTPAEVFALDEIKDLQAELPSLRFLNPVVSPDAAWNGPVGTAVDIMDAELGGLPDGVERPDIYLCGPPAFLDAARAGAIARGVPDGQIYEERILRN